VTDDNSSETLSALQQSQNSLRELSQQLSELTLARRPRKGQFGYKLDTDTLPSSESSLSATPSSDFNDLWSDPAGPTHTPPTSPPQFTAPADSSDEEMTNPTFFYGDDHPDDMVPGDYLKTVMNTFKETSSNSFRVQRLRNGLATNSVAEEWFDRLDPATKVDWDLVEAAFRIIWPRQVLVAQTTKQRRQRLRSEKLKKEAIGVTVFSNGVEMTGQARWVNKIQSLALLADDPTGALIHSVRENMPTLMRKLVKGSFDTWVAFGTAVKAVSDEEIESAVSEEKRISTVEEESKKLRMQLLLQSPTAPLRTAFSGFGLDRRASPAGAASVITNDVNIFQGGTMGAGNVMCGFQAPSRGSPNVPGSSGFGRGGTGFRDARLRHADLSTNTKDMVQHLDTPQGKAAYAQQVAAWKAANPNKYKGGDEFAPYPLTPRTDPVGSDECFTCGLHHRIGSTHLCSEVDPFEMFYRRVANRIIKDSRTPPTAAAVPTGPVPSNVHWVDATDTYPGHYIPYQSNQGNGDGPGA
jgi:hypothetical protein